MPWKPSDVGKVSRERNKGRPADLQASQAVFCFRGGGRIFASSCMWLCADWEGIVRAGQGRGEGRRWERAKKDELPGPEG